MPQKLIEKIVKWFYSFIEKLDHCIDAFLECIVYGLSYVTMAHFLDWTIHTIGVVSTAIITFVIMSKFKKWYIKNYDNE